MATVALPLIEAPLDRFVRPRSRQPAHQRHRPLQYPLLLLHAGDGRAFRAARRDSGFRGDRTLRAHRGVAGRHQVARHRRRAAGAARFAGADPAAGGHSGNPRSGPDHQRRAAAANWRRRSTMPACGASTCTSTRWTANASRRSRAATIFPKCWPDSSEAKRLGYSAIKLNAVAVKNLVEPDIVPLARYRARERLRGALHRVHAARRAGSLGPA